MSCHFADVEQAVTLSRCKPEIFEALMRQRARDLMRRLGIKETEITPSMMQDAVHAFEIVDRHARYDVVRSCELCDELWEGKWKRPCA